MLLIGLVIVRGNERQSRTQVTDWPYYQIIINYNLFRPLGWQPPDASPQYELIATNILFGESSKALIRETSSSQTYYVGIGAQIRENQVCLNISNKSISLSRGVLQFLNLDQGSRVNLEGKKKPKKDLKTKGNEAETVVKRKETNEEGKQLTQTIPKGF